MEKTQQFINQHKDKFVSELFSLLRIPSVSADPAFQQEVAACATHLATHLNDIGLDGVEVISTAGHPIVYAEKIIDASLPTVLVYGHYDVQPADPLELWHTPAFEPVIKQTAIHPDGAIFARGACDDKGQFFMHVKAVEAMLQAQELPCNLKLMIEGEEEVGSPNLAIFVRDNKTKLRSGINDSERNAASDGFPVDWFEDVPSSRQKQFLERFIQKNPSLDQGGKFRNDFLDGDEKATEMVSAFAENEIIKEISKPISGARGV